MDTGNQENTEGVLLCHWLKAGLIFFSDISEQTSRFATRFSLSSHFQNSCTTLPKLFHFLEVLHYFCHFKLKKNSIHLRIRCWTLLGRNRNRNRIHICKSMKVYKIYIMIIWRATWLHCWLCFNLQLLLAALPTSNQVAIWWKTSRHRFLRDFQRFRKRFSNRSNEPPPGTTQSCLELGARCSIIFWGDSKHRRCTSPTTTIRSFVFPPYFFDICFLFVCLIWFERCDVIHVI